MIVNYIVNVWGDKYILTKLINKKRKMTSFEHLEMMIDLVDVEIVLKNRRSNF